MKKSKFLKICALALSLVMLVGLAACGNNNGTEATDPAGTAGGRTDLDVRLADSFTMVDPHKWSINSDNLMSSQIYEPLYYLNSELEETPCLATDYTVSEDGLDVTFTIREGVTFSNGDPMTVADVKYSYDRAMASAYVSGYISTLESVSADEAAGTVTLHYSIPTPGFMTGVAYVMIASEAYTEATVDENGLLGFNACGTGPYMMDSYVADVSVSMKANPTYWRCEVPIEGLNFYLINDENTAVNALRSGEIDICTTSTSNWDSLVSSGDFQTAELASNHVTYLIFNTEVAPFDNALVRQAIACAVNREDVITMAQSGRATPAYSLATSYMMGYAEIEPQFTYDPDRARELLAEAGYPDGLDIGEIQTLAGTYFADTVVVVQQQLAEVGITSSIANLEANTLIANTIGGNFTMADMGQSNSYDMSWMDTYYHTNSIDSINMARYSNPEVDALLAEAAACMDHEERVQLYAEILSIVDEASAYIPLYNINTCVAFAQGLNYTPNITVNLFVNASWAE